jgi:glycine/D-amino acid oxidase-like deaminating enzyme
MFDAIIIGGGMAGISVAHFFRKRKILILERGALLSGATGSNAGFIVSGLGEHFNNTASRWGIERAREIQEIHLSNHRRIRELAANADCDYNATGSFCAALSEKERDDLQVSCDLLRSSGFPVEWSAKPPIGTIQTLGALFNPGDASIDSAKFWPKLAAGIPTLTQCEVREIRQTSIGNHLVTNRGEFEASIVFFCLNAFSAPLVPELEGRYIPLRGQMLELGLNAAPPMLCPVMADYGDVYWRYCQDRLLFGGLEHRVAGAEVGIARVVSPEVTQVQLDWIRRNFDPIFGGDAPNSQKTWCSTMAFTVDGFPFVGALPRKDQYVLAGLCGLGHGYAMECAFWLHELIENGRDIIPAYFRGDRIESLPVYQGGDWRTLYEAWNH